MNVVHRAGLRLLVTLLAILAAALGADGARAAELARDQTAHLGVGVGDIRTLDPFVSVGVGEVPIVQAIYEGLVRFPDGRLSPDELEPGLAESWSLGDDRLTWTFKLRKGVKWHGDYGEFTAEDVKFSIERVKDQATGSPFRDDLAVIESVTVVDPYTVRIKTAQVTPELPALLVNRGPGYIVSKKAVTAGVDLRTRPIGTGPFALQEYRPRERVTLVRNDAYWRGKPTLERLVFHFMPDDSTRELALRNGEVHAIDIPAKQDWVDRLRKAGFAVDLTAPANTFILHLNLTQKPLDDIRVRRALAHAINRDDLIAFLGKDVAYPEYSPLPQGYLGHTSDVPRYPYDPDKARQLLAEAGHASGLSFSMSISNNNIYLPPMQLIQQHWKRIGVTVDLRVVDHPTYHRLIRQNLNPFVIYGAYRYPLTGTPYFSQFFHSNAIIGKPTAITNFSHYGGVIPGVDDLIEAARFEPDVNKQTRAWMEAQRRIMTDAVAIPLFTRRYAMARHPSFDLGFEQKSWSFYTPTERSRLLKR
ncbi:MAG TPA: ABC transporter substrate-binding protein [Thermodesulfobacteriota bacterium]